MTQTPEELLSLLAAEVKDLRAQADSWFRKHRAAEGANTRYAVAIAEIKAIATDEELWRILNICETVVPNQGTEKKEG